MENFIPGQRCISNADLKLGLGTIIKCEQRTVTVHFLSTGETFTYARQTAPLTRAKFATGDQIKSHEGWEMVVETINESEGLLTYIGRDDDGSTISLPEAELDNQIQLNKPTDRLFNGQIDHERWFNLRSQTLAHLSRVHGSPLFGLTGARTSLIPHQLFIAHEVARRYAPRVLLADEVGLGKTIEAGLILHQQLLTEQAQRVLIVVPESLMHQWIVEMMRRFNLSFSLFDEERCLAIESSSDLENPFHAEQLIIVTLESLIANPRRHQQAVQAEWDLLVVDEAHHLEWSPEQPGVEYQAIEMLANSIAGVLLLTATPEQLGKESHFARLRLLDPDRFPSFEQFVEEEQDYQPIAEIVELLLSGSALNAAQISIIEGLLSDSEKDHLINCLDNLTEHDKEELIEHLLDRHGTGRVLFRNTRNAIKGFPERQLNTYPLALPEAYKTLLNDNNITAEAAPQMLLSPELLFEEHADLGMPDWSDLDPRVEWLSETIKSLRPHKVLVITSSASTAMDLAQTLKTRSGIHAAMFHEGMSLLERDRAAAYFADMEFGSQLLICSEIGSEGRNFQFAHHLVLFDLPLNPDLLEQRIGRLDRIGQQQTIQLHLPYIEDSPQALMVDWYHKGLNAFEKTTPAGHTVFSLVEEQLVNLLRQPECEQAAIDELHQQTATIHQKYLDEMHNGRDLLLEYNSCRPQQANQLVEQNELSDNDQLIDDYLEQLFDCYGIDSELHTQTSLVITPNEGMQGHHFPMLNEEGMTITTDRNTALSNEDIAFINWEHPMIAAAMEMTLSNELGNSALTSFKHPNVKAGTLLLETIFVVETTAKKSLHTSKYLPSSLIRVVIDPKGRDYTDKVSSESLLTATKAVNAETALAVIKSYKPHLQKMVTLCEAVAQQQSEQLIEEGKSVGSELLQNEINRLLALKKVNPNIRDEEVTFFETQLSEVLDALNNATIRLDAQRVLVAT